MEHPGETLRKALELTQEEFARSIGRSGPYVCQVEGGRDFYGRVTVLRIAERYREDLNRLGITVEDLLRGCRVQPTEEEPTEAA
jgi:transcriptional regulator with XRE-family HTH domain